MLLAKYYSQNYYLRQGGYVFIGIITNLFSQFVCLQITQKLLNRFHKIWWKGGKWTTEEAIRFRW